MTEGIYLTRAGRRVETCPSLEAALADVRDRADAEPGVEWAVWQDGKAVVRLEVGRTP